MQGMEGGAFLTLALFSSHSQRTDNGLEGDGGLDSTFSLGLQLPSLIFPHDKVYNSCGAGGVISFRRYCVRQKKKIHYGSILDCFRVSKDLVSFDA